MFLTPLLVRAAPWALLVCMGCVEPVQLSVNEPLDSGPPDVSLLDAALEADGMPRPDQAPPLPENTDAAPQPEPAECGNGQIEEGEQCDAVDEHCVDCRIVSLTSCAHICSTENTVRWSDLTYIESISDFEVEGDTYFGSSLAVDERQAIIGAPGTHVGNDGAAEGSGQVYFLKFDDGRLNRTDNENGMLARRPDDGEAGSQFGGQVSIADRFAFVSARFQPNGEAGMGRVYGYERSDGEWRRGDDVSPWPGTALGSGLALDENTLAFNVIREDGLHYVQSYLLSLGLAEIATPLGGQQPLFDGVFGEQIALKEQWMLVNVGPLTMEPRVVGYRGEGFLGLSWDRVRAYRPMGAAEFSGYGFSMDSNGDFNVFGAPTDENEGTRCGAVYIIRGSVQSQRLTPEQCEEGARFGHSVAMDDDRLLIGSPGYAGGSGQVFSYRRDGTAWVLDGPPVMDPHGEGTRFGTSLGLGDGFALVGAPRESGVAEDAMGRGRVLVYHFVEGPLCFEDDGSCYCAEGFIGDRCECGLEAFEENDYLFCDELMSWQSARDTCIANGMDLVVVDGAEENRWLADTRAVRLGAPAWLGLRDIDMMANWVWVDGSPLSYTAWNGGQPDNPMDDQQDCVALNGIGWEDFRCSREQPFICEPVQQPSDNP